MSERREIIMRLHERYHYLYPVSVAEEEALREHYPAEKDLWVTIRRKRSNAHHNKYWAMLARVIESGATRYHSARDLHNVLKIEMGYVKYLRRLNGDTILEPDSIAFDKMDQIAFNKFFDAARLLIVEHFGIDPLELKG